MTEPALCMKVQVRIERQASSALVPSFGSINFRWKRVGSCIIARNPSAIGSSIRLTEDS